MAVRGLGCPVRFLLTAGQKGDAPQADALIEGLPADFVMGDTAYDSDRLRQGIAAKGAEAVIPNNPSRAQKCPIDKHLYAQRHLIECCFSKCAFRRLRPLIPVDRDHLFRSIATSVTRVHKAPLDVVVDGSLRRVGQVWQDSVPVVNRRDPRVARSALTADAAARAGGPC